MVSGFVYALKVGYIRVIYSQEQANKIIYKRAKYGH